VALSFRTVRSVRLILLGAHERCFERRSVLINSLCPDVELRSSYDSISLLQEKVEEYIATAPQLSWLIDPMEL